MSILQAIASPFRFDALLRGLEAAPYIFSTVTAAEEEGEAEHSQPASNGAVAGSSGQAVSPAKSAVPLVEVAADVRARVHAILGPEVGGLPIQMLLPPCTFTCKNLNCHACVGHGASSYVLPPYMQCHSSVDPRMHLLCLGPAGV